jgi:hypothetical protein
MSFPLNQFKKKTSCRSHENSNENGALLPRRACSPGRWEHGRPSLARVLAWLCLDFHPPVEVLPYVGSWPRRCFLAGARIGTARIESPRWESRINTTIEPHRTGIKLGYRRQRHGGAKIWAALGVGRLI